MARKEQERRAVEAQRRADWAARDAIVAAEEAKEAEQTARLRRCFLHRLSDGRRTALWGLVDLSTQELTTFAPDASEPLVQALSKFQIVVGLDARLQLEALGLEPSDWRLVDLKLPQKSRTLNRSGRKLRITTELLIAGTTGISRPLAPPAKVAELASAASTGKLERRLAADLRALLAYYRYGAFHHYIRLRWGFLDEIIGVDWGLPGDPALYEVLKHAMDTGSDLEVVTGSPPAMSDPWGRAVRCKCLEVESWEAKLEVDGRVHWVLKSEIFAARVAR
ncbi:MAG: hypothetical protein QM765_19970 [Myxococcales bacterium]